MAAATRDTAVAAVDRLEQKCATQAVELQSIAEQLGSMQQREMQQYERQTRAAKDKSMDYT